MDVYADEWVIAVKEKGLDKGENLIVKE